MRVRLLSALGIVVLLVVMTPARAFAQTDDQGSQSQLGGYVAGAAGWAFSFQPFIPALLPTGDAPFETTVSLSTANIRSGGNALGRGALIWPGSAAANLGPLFAEAAGQPALAGLTPPWPGAVEANADQGEQLKSISPLAKMRAFGSPTRAEGESVTPDVDFPGVLKINSVSSRSVAEVTDVDVTSTCVVHLEGISLLNGAINIDSINSRSLTQSTGDSSKADGDVQVAGLTVTGIAAELTGDGLHVKGLPDTGSPVPGAGSAFPGTNPDDALNQALKALGVSISLTRATNTVAGGGADRLANGVLVSINDPAFPGSHFDITLATTGSSALATLPVSTEVSGVDLSAGGGELGGAGLSATSSPTPNTSGAFSASPLGGLALGSPSSGGAAVNTPGASTPISGSLTGYHFKGVPVALIVILLLASIFIARWLRGFLRTRLLS